MKLNLKGIVLLLLMVVAAAVAKTTKPTHIMAKTRGNVQLESMVPNAFGNWKLLEQSTGQVVNPQQTALLESLYSQVLTRRYVNADGAVIMLSIAYGENQTDGLGLHYPDVCYPAQGFSVNSTSAGLLTTLHGDIRVKRLETELGRRKEPLTYWSTMGNHVVQGGTERRLEQLRYGLKGQIPDGLIFRVSNITGDTQLAYDLQQQFVNDLLNAMPSDQRQFLSGLL